MLIRDFIVIRLFVHNPLKHYISRISSYYCSFSWLNDQSPYATFVRGRYPIDRWRMKRCSLVILSECFNDNNVTRQYWFSSLVNILKLKYTEFFKVCSRVLWTYNFAHRIFKVYLAKLFVTLVTEHNLFLALNELMFTLNLPLKYRLNISRLYKLW